ncbi:MAG: hypothetical protein QOG09_138 [Solirubrobacterales bacterium]|nr:hypothetical protein [Solirubrobacterales bacterium]
MDRTLLARARMSLAVTAAALGLSVMAPALAQAGVAAGAGVSFPTTVSVGDTAVPALITMSNQDTAPNQADTNTVCNAGDGSPPCGFPEPGIVLTPACKQLSGGACAVGGAEPSVFQISPTGVGQAGTACAGVAFSTTLVDAAFGTVRFAPPPGAHVLLAGAAASCQIDFTVEVLKQPTVDQDPATPGIQTAQATQHTQFSGAASSLARSTSNLTVLPDTTAPITNFGSKTIKRSARKATFRFSSNEAGSTFLCKLDSRPFSRCSSPKKYRHLALGKHKFKVRARDAAGNLGNTIVKKFTI